MLFPCPLLFSNTTTLLGTDCSQQSLEPGVECVYDSSSRAADAGDSEVSAVYGRAGGIPRDILGLLTCR